MSEYDAIDIDGYTYVSTDGKTSGRINGDVVITVHYVTEEPIDIPENPIAGGDKPNPDPGSGNDDTVLIDDGQTPGAALPEGGYTEVTAPDGKLPQTGTVAEPVNNAYTLGAIALLLSMSLAGLFYSRKDEENN